MGDGAPGCVVRFETQFIVQCEGRGGDWFDFAITPAYGNAQAKFKECQQYRPASYRIVRRKTQDVLLSPNEP